ncbi:MAG: hypothetical protein ACRDG5_10355 [Anaerolineales bacterium]
MDWLMIILRVLHILAGVFWAGGAFLVAAVIQPAMRDLGPEAGKFMLRLADRGRLSAYSSAAAGINVLTGLVMYERVSGGYSEAWLLTGRGLALTIGAWAGLIAFVVGIVVLGRAGRRLGELGKALQATGQPPSSQQQAEMMRLQRRMSAGGTWVATLLVISILGMSSAQYLLF